jgi:hypothetical protein
MARKEEWSSLIFLCDAFSPVSGMPISFPPPPFPETFLLNFRSKTCFSFPTRGRFLGRNWDKNLQSFPPCYLQFPSPLPLPTPHPPSKSDLKLVYGILESENSQDYLCPETSTKWYVHEFVGSSWNPKEASFLFHFILL